MGGISMLPEGIVHHILSFLEPKEAIRASLLSKAWLSAWQAKPNLWFQDSDFNIRNLATNTRDLARYREEKIGIDSLKFNLEKWGSYEASKDTVESWLQVSVENGVRILNFSKHCLDDYLFPWVVFQAKSLVELEISLCDLQLQESQKIRCQNLKILVLWRVYFEESTLEKIMSSCKLIDTLKIMECFGFDNLKVTNLQKLKHLELVMREDDIVAVQSSSLEYFSCDTISSGCSNFEGSILSRLTLHACPNLKTLDLAGVAITDNFFSNFDGKFPLLEKLSVRCCHLVQRIKFSSHSVKRVDLQSNDGLKEVEVDILNMVWTHDYEWDMLTGQVPSN